MTAGGSNGAFDGFRRSLAGMRSLDEVLSRTVEFIGQSIKCDKVSITFCLPGNAEVLSRSWSVHEQNSASQEDGSVFRLEDGRVYIETQRLSLPLLVGDCARHPAGSALSRLFAAGRMRSFAMFEFSCAAELRGWVECSCKQNYHRWRRDEVLQVQRIIELAGFQIERLEQRAAAQQPASAPEQKSPQQSRSHPLIRHGDLIIVKVDPHLVITEIQGDTVEILGVEGQELLGDSSIWAEFVHAEDLRRLLRIVRSRENSPVEISEELRLVNRKTLEVRCFLIKAVPLISDGGVFEGWEAFGLDITDKKQTEEELLSQSRRIEALYEVSRSLQVDVDPAQVALKGLRALISATNSNCGFACFYERDSRRIEIVAAQGLSEKYLEAAPRIVNEEKLMRTAIESGSGIILENLQRDPRANQDLARIENLKSVIIMPLSFEGTALGAIALFCRRPGRYSDADFDLVQAASSQIALAARQAELYAAEKRQAESLSALYRLTHELSRFSSPGELVEHAFPIIQKEFDLKRMWFGVLNDQRTHVIGQGGFGPGVRGGLVDMQIELELRHDFLDEALRTRQPVVVEAGREMECSGLNRLIKRLDLGTFIIVPLVSLQQVVGVLVVEPAMPAAFFTQSKLPLLANMASEIAAVILARRFESRMSDADKMRMAGLLASGVAHNFNNMLQAVMGQASLIEMQVPAGSQLSSAARTIIDAATKGASLVKHLVSLTLQNTSERRPVAIQKMFQESRIFYESVLGSTIKLEIGVEAGAPEILADYGKIQQVISNLLVNAKEAIGSRSDGCVRMRARRVRLRSGEVAPDLGPGAYLQLDVEDNGIGMDEEMLARCFEPFFTTKNVDARTGLGFEGSGLGLSSVYSIVRQHEGMITARSQPGQGSVFSIYLPAAVSRRSERYLDASRGREAAVLTLDTGLGHQLSVMLHHAGRHAHMFSQSDRALEFMRLAGQAVEMLFLDVEGTVYNAPSLVRLLRSRFPDLKIVLIGAESGLASERLRPLEGSIEIVHKPVQTEALEDLISRLLGVDVKGSLAAQVTVERSEAVTVPGTGTPEDQAIEEGTWRKDEPDTGAQ